MSNPQHKVLSDKLRQMLRDLDDPRLTKTGKLDLSKQETKVAMSTAKPESLRQKNLKVLMKKTMTREEREAEAKRLAEAARPIFPDARVMFVQNTFCTHCQVEHEGMAHPLIFIRLRRLLPGPNPKFDPASIRYIPERELEPPPEGKLPKLILHYSQRVSSCPKCFQKNAVHLFSGPNIESSIVSPIHTGTAEQSLSLTSINSSDSPCREDPITPDSVLLPRNTKEHLLSPVSLECVSASSETELLTTAPVPHTIVPIGAEEETAIRQAELQAEALSKTA